MIDNKRGSSYLNSLPEGLSAEECDRYSAVVSLCWNVLGELQDVEFKWHEPLAYHTTFRVGGPAACLARPRSESALLALLERVRENSVPYVVLGGGSNVIVTDGPIPALVIQLIHVAAGLAFSKGRSSSRPLVVVGAGVPISRLLRFCVRNELGGLECLVGIPGSVGGAVVMNAGTAEGTIAETLEWLDALDGAGQRQLVFKADLPAGYRCMGLSEDWLILGGAFRLRVSSGRSLKREMRSLMVRRKATQPLGWPSAGCVFKNPVEAPAGALIERAGLKGFRMGNAQVSDKHANWIINLGSARARDILALISLVENEVFGKFGVRLEREIRILSPEKNSLNQMLNS